MATLKLRRGSSFTSPQISEPFFNSTNNTLLVGYGTGIGEQITLVNLGANTGSVELTGDLTASNITLTGDLSARNVSLSGNIIIGDEVADNIIVQAAFSGSLIPSSSNEYDLGTTTKKWKNLFVVSASIDDVTLPGSNIVSSSQQISDYTKFLEIQGDDVVSGSIQVDHDATTNFVSNEHINHTQVSIFAGNGMSGGGNIAGNRTITLSTGSAHFLEGVKKKINTEDVVSGSIQVDHDATTNFVSNEHINHTSVTMTAGAGLTGGGTIASTRTFNVVSANNGILINADNIELVNNSSTFTDGVKEKLNTETVISGSSQVNADNVTNFDTNVKDKLNIEDVVSGSQQVVDHLPSGTVSGSIQVVLNDADLTGFDTSDVAEGTRLYYTNTRVRDYIRSIDVISGSQQVNADNVTNFDSNVKDKMNLDDVISGSSQVNADNVTNFDTNVRDAVSVASGVVNYDSSTGIFTVPSHTNHITEHSTNLFYTDARVKTKLNAEEVVSGSSQIPLGGDLSGTADSATVEKVQGVSLTSAEATQLSNIGTSTISSTQWGYLGSSNQGIATTDNVIFNDGDFTGDVQVTGNLTVLGSATEIQTSELRIEDKLITVASGSADSAAADGAGIEIDGAGKSLKWDHNTTSFVLDAKVSSSVGFKGEGGELTGIDTDQVTEGSNLYYTDTRVKTKLNSETVISGSTQVNITHLDTDDLSEGSTNLYFTNARAEAVSINNIVEDTSPQLGANLDAQTFNITTTGKVLYSNVYSTEGDLPSASTYHGMFAHVHGTGKGYYAHGGNWIKLIDESSSDTDDLTEGSNLYYTDTRVKTKLNTETVISGSSQVNADNVTNFDTNVRDYIRSQDVISGSQQVNADSITNFDTNVRDYIRSQDVISGSIQVNADSITNFDSNVKDKMNLDDVISGSSQLHTDLDLRYLEITGDNVVSGSEQIDIHNTTGYVANENIDHSSVSIGSGKGLTGGGTIVTNRSLTLNTGSNHFGEGVINALTGSGIISSSVLSSTSVQGQVSLTQNGTATSVTLNNLATSNNPTFQGLTLENVSALDSTHYNVFMSGSGGVVGKRTLATAAFYHVSSSISDGNVNVLGNAGAVKTYIDEALIEVGAGDITKVTAGLGMSGSTDSGEAVVAIDTGSLHFQSGVLETFPDGVVSGSTQLLSDLDGRYLEINGDNVISGSIQVDVTATTNYSSINQYSDTKVKNKLDADGVISGSEQISLSGFSTSDVSEGTNKYYTDVRVKTKLNAETVISGSSQVNANNVTNFDTNVRDYIRSIDVISGSSQVSLGGDLSGTANSATVEKVQGVSLTSGEATQLANIGTSTISSTQWGYLGSSNQGIATTDNVNFADGDFTGNVQINGNLIVQGSSSELQVSELRVEDKLITVASGSATSLDADGAGIEIAGAGESITWDHSESRFAISDDIHVTGTIKASDDIIAYASSDIELKNNIQPIENPIEKINQLSGNSFNWNEEKQNIYKGKDYGVIAQEIEKVLPELVIERENGYKAVKYDKLVSLLIEGIKELSSEVNQLKQKINKE